jgi:hypothetical protein
MGSYSIGLWEPVLACHFPAKQYICFLLTLSYIVNNQRPLFAAKPGNHNAYMRSAIA